MARRRAASVKAATSEEPIDVWLRTCFLPSQRKWILEPARIALLLKTRQGGFSDATAAGAVLGGFVYRRPQVVLSVNEERAHEVLRQARLHCEFLASLGMSAAKAYTVRDGKVKGTDNTKCIAWPTGGSITAVPANPRTARSLHGDIWLDEYAYHQDPAGIRDGAFAMSTRQDYQLRILSTPNGAVGQFYEWAHALEHGHGPPGWAFHRVTIDDCVAEGMSVDWEHLLHLAHGDDRVFDQWYRCAWLDGDLQYLPSAWIERAQRWIGPDPSYARAEFYAGYDVGRTNDLAVVTIVALLGDMVYVLPPIATKRTNYRLQRQLIAEARERFGWRKLIVDANGIGSGPAEELVYEYGEDEVIPLMFTSQDKDKMATGVFRWLREDKLRLPRGEAGQAIANEAKALRRIVSDRTGHVSYDIPRGKDGHGDRFWSMALALLGAGEPPVPRGLGATPLTMAA